MRLPIRCARSCLMMRAVVLACAFFLKSLEVPPLASFSDQAWLQLRGMFEARDCKSIAKWLSMLLTDIACFIDTDVETWGAYDALQHTDLNLMGPSGSKRRKLNKGFKDAVRLTAMHNKRAATVSAMMRATCPDLSRSSYRVMTEHLWEHRAATIQTALHLHVVGLCYDGVRIGKPARELVPIYCWFGRERLGSAFPPAVQIGPPK